MSSLAQRNLKYLEKKKKLDAKDAKKEAARNKRELAKQQNTQQNSEEEKPKRSFLERANDSALHVATIANTKVKATIPAQIFIVNELLKDNPDKSFTREEIESFNDEVDFSNPELLESLKQKPNVHIEEGFGDVTFKYNPNYDLKDIDEVRDFFARETSSSGIPMDKIIDSYQGIEDDLKVLAENREIIIIEQPAKRKSDKKRTIFGNNTSYELDLPKDLKDTFIRTWHSTEIPTFLEEEMTKYKIPITKKAAPAKAPGGKQKRKRILKSRNVTNQHLEDHVQNAIELNQRRQAASFQ